MDDVVKKLRKKIALQDDVQRIIFAQKAANLQALYAGQISVEAWIARLHKTNRQLKSSQAIVRALRKDIQELNPVKTVGKFAVGVDV